MNPFSKSSTTFVVFASLMLASFSFNALAGATEDAQALLNKKDYDGALTLINASLKKDKSNEKLLLLKGITLVRADKLEFAARHYKKLKRKLKGNPEPSNNLAMVYRMQSDYPAAIKEFNKTIKAYPDYVRAYENLGDTYVLMAQTEYQRGVDATKNGVLAHKVNLSQNFHQVATRPKVAPKQAVAKKAAPAKKQAVAKTAKAVPVAKAPVQAATKPATPRQLVFSSLKTWVQAWSDRDANRYLSHYSQEFKPDLGLSVKQWVDRKKRILSNSSFININLKDIKIAFDTADTASIDFNQKYESDGFNTTSNKTLKLKKYDNKWLIIQEISKDA